MVAPHVGAWIEMRERAESNRPEYVAPHVGAWIEIFVAFCSSDCLSVAPHVGAWIEIASKYDDSLRLYGRTPRGCVD